jgi:3-methylcrotonyl-CoA carboxylase alpha subunit
MFKRILIANRGEIACRIISTCRRLGVEAVAVYSDADAGARHVRMADFAVRVGPAAAAQSYLKVEAILDAARQSGAEAVHPGYGFLSENPQFAQSCVDAGLIFIGPSVSAMQAMSSKATAKQLMERSGVPMLPGYHGEAQDTATLRAAAKRIGYPVLIKATAGGGGKGMRIVESDAQFEERLASCQREAKNSFGDARVLLEKYLLRPRHIEVQIFGDNQGQIVHLFERDCSSQRRHQKVLEEAPAPNFSESQRTALTQAACSAGAAVAYTGAGTVEFLFDPTNGSFYFMEMNTRIQVEHPVTELITGLDLVEWQLRVAAGEPLPASQPAIHRRGHAIEVRLYAEVPEAGFLPSSGTLTRFDLPAAGANVRVDSGIGRGDTVGIDYDPMLAKLIVRGDSRDEAIVTLQRALADVRIEGLGHNTRFLRRLATTPEFERGEMDITLIERSPAMMSGVHRAPDEKLLAAAALWVVLQDLQSSAPVAATSPWAPADGWRLNLQQRREVHFEYQTADDVTAEAVVWVRYDAGQLAIRSGAHSDFLPASLHDEGQTQYFLRLGEQGVRVQIEAEAGTLRLTVGHDEYRLLWRDPRQPEVESAQADGNLGAPMPGRIIAHLATAGAEVAKGAPLLIMEAMKMEHTICAPASGTVRAYLAAVGQQVKEGSQLIDFEIARRN